MTNTASLESVCLICEPEAFEGVRRVVGKVADDFARIGRERPEVTTTVDANDGRLPVLIATLGHSPLVDQLVATGKFDASQLAGKREVFAIELIDNPFDGVGKCLLIVGSDKRGTIYGAFTLSEHIGVSPLYFWGDAPTIARNPLVVTDDLLGVSHEPSVKYRGFFINDEWPCFGNWTMDHFGGFNADMYDTVFELLLRLKGNYLWPAMWTSSFPLDGPGAANEALADMYGVVIGASHHEPCLRASEEWDKVRGPDSPYGNEWNWHTNAEGLTNYWADALKRSGQYEKLITIGMRGERDSAMGADWTLADNIKSLEDIIAKQRELIRANVPARPNGEEPPELLAVYKEVEEYFYGDEDTPGLRDWPGLDGVTLMLCEDNFGFVRSLPTAEMRAHPGGFGMYYHFDYHGGPVSYEWVPSTTFERTWEQMSQAYDYGIRDVWIVNVGDLKFNEVPLAYFMKLAYDFERWGTDNPNAIDEYTANWLGATFQDVAESTRAEMAEVLHGYLRLNAMRRPEAQNAFTFDPAHYQETDRILARAEEVESLNELIYASLHGADRDAYYSMIYWPAKASINLLRMNLYAGLNRHFADQGKPVANKYADLVGECIEKDRALAHEFAEFRGGKWAGMELAPHVGFTSWNEDGNRYPTQMRVEPMGHPRLMVSRKDAEPVYRKQYGPPMSVPVSDFIGLPNPGPAAEATIEVANDGTGELEFEISVPDDAPWLAISPTHGTVRTGEQVDVTVACAPGKLPPGEARVKALISAHDAGTRDVDAADHVELDIRASALDVSALPRKTFVPKSGVVAIDARDFADQHGVWRDGGECGFVGLDHYGRSSALRGGDGFGGAPISGR